MSVHSLLQEIREGAAAAAQREGIARTRARRLRIGVALGSMLALGLGLAACGAPGDSQTTTTFARSFGGPGDDFAVDLATDASGRLVVAGVYSEPLIGGGSSERLWLLGLDEAGNVRHEVTPTRDAGVGRNVRFRIARETADDGVLHAGRVETEDQGVDVVLQRLAPDGSVAWNLQLDSGVWSGARPYDTRARPGADDELIDVYGDEVDGWYVVARSIADLAPTGSGGGAVVVNARSIVVWFVEPDGTLRWQRRIAATQNDEDLLSGPMLHAALRLASGELALAVHHLDSSRPDVSILWLDDANGLLLSDDFEPSREPDAGEEIPDVGDDSTFRRRLLFIDSHETKLLDTLDGGVLYVRHWDESGGANDSGAALTEVIKLDALGSELWRSEFEAEGTHDGSHGRVYEQLALTFPDGDPENPVHWIGRYDWSPTQAARTSVLWQLDADGELLRRCELDSGGYAFLYATQPVDGGLNLRVLVGDLEHDPDDSNRVRLREFVIGSDCGSALPGRTYTYSRLDHPNSTSTAVAMRTPYWVGDELVVPLHLSDWDGRLSLVRFEETAVLETRPFQATMPLPPPLRDDYSGYQNFGSIGASTEGRVVWNVGRSAQSAATQLFFDPDGDVERNEGMSPPPVDLFRDVYSGYVSTNALFADSGRVYWGDSPGYCRNDLNFLVRDPDQRLFFSRHEAADRRFGIGGVRIAPARNREFSALLLPCSRPGSGLLEYATDDRASVRYLPPELAEQEFDRLDQSDDATLMLNRYAGSGPGNQVVRYPAGAGPGWHLRLPVVLGASNSSVLELVDGILAHDGGALLLLRLQAFALPSALADPSETFGDVDLGLLKLDAEGRGQWLRVYGTGGNDEPKRIVRTPGGFGVLASSDALDAVTPGSRDIWVLHTGPDGHIQGLESGEDLCQACLGTLSGEALAALLPFEAEPIPPLSEPETLEFERTQIEPQDSLAPFTETLPSPNTARQCVGDATDFQELPLGVDPPPAACEDGLDNDMDGLIDLADPGCLNADDDSEIDPPPVQRELRIEVVGDGRVFSAPDPGIDCREGDVGSAACRESYPNGETARVVVEQDAGAVFQGWSGDCPEGTTATLDLLMDRNRVCRAQFSRVVVPEPQRMTVSLQTDGGAVNDPSQGGTVVGSGIQCFGTGSDCEEDYPFGTFAELLAVPTTGFVFDGWSSPDPAQPCEAADPTEQRIDVVMNRARSCRALFRTAVAGPDLFLRVIADTDGIHRSTNALGGHSDGGTVTSTNPTTRPDVSCTPIQTFCAREFSPGTPVTLTATPEPGHRFVRWFSPTDASSPCNPGTTSTTITLTLDEATTCRASFGTLPSNPGGATNRLSVLFDVPFDRPHAVRVIDVDRHLVDCTAGPCQIDYPHAGQPVRLRLVDQYGGGVVDASCDDQTQADVPGIARPLCSENVHLGNRTLIIQWTNP
ncbi:MAG: hypothetical protein R3F21_23240 [Myxococcota bacterium]